MTESTTKRVRISQWDALLLESLRSLGWSQEELIRRVQQNELPTDGPSDFDYTELVTAAGVPRAGGVCQRSNGWISDQVQYDPGHSFVDCRCVRAGA